MEVIFSNRSDSLKNGSNIDPHASTAGFDELSTQQLDQVYGGMAEALHLLNAAVGGASAGFTAWALNRWGGK
ncbi:Blp family class II bacteriocin [Acidithiobacillus sp. M4-SHS-6]|uniref:Blp family class II bacteriocin n=1 Tax=Acidithiobacillus sp. M4-SHS-6 TaxID=3383024 RepID=UPI0039BDB467